MKRPTPLFKIHDSTPIHARRPDSGTWTVFHITRKTANSVFIVTPDGLVQLDRIALERTGRVKRRGTWYHLRRPEFRRLEERLAS